MSAIWQEIDRLRKKIDELEKSLARQLIKSALTPDLKLGKVLAVSSTQRYTVQNRTVDDLANDCFAEVRVVPGDPGPAIGDAVNLLRDAAGERYILPTGGKLILVQDLGGSEGKLVEKDADGAVTMPAWSEILPIVVAEPNANFHASTPALESGRIYFGQRLADENGDGYYLVYLEGHGAADYDFDVVIGAETLRVTTDYAGKIVSAEAI